MREPQPPSCPLAGLSSLPRDPAAWENGPALKPGSVTHTLARMSLTLTLQVPTGKEGMEGVLAEARPAPSRRSAALTS